MKSIRCLLGRHTTTPPSNNHWYPTWRCCRCGTDLRTRPVPPTADQDGGA